MFSASGCVGWPRLRIAGSINGGGWSLRLVIQSLLLLLVRERSVSVCCSACCHTPSESKSATTDAVRREMCTRVTEEVRVCCLFR